MAVLVCRLFVTRQIHTPSALSSRAALYTISATLCACCARHWGNIQQRRPLSFSKVRRQGGHTIFAAHHLYHWKCPSNKGWKDLSALHLKRFFSISHRLKSAAYISNPRSAELSPKVKWVEDCEFLSFIKNAEGSQIRHLWIFASYPRRASFPPVSSKHFQKKTVKKCQDAYLHRTRQGRSVGGTAGSCWGAVRRFLLSPLLPGKHQEDW